MTNLRDVSVLGIIKNRFRRQIKSRKNVAESNPDASARIAANILKHISITCRCGEISIPAGLVGDTYKCIRCHKEKIHSRYNLIKLEGSYNPLTNMDFYDAAIALLKKDKKKRLTMKEIKYRLEN